MRALPIGALLLCFAVVVCEAPKTADREVSGSAQTSQSAHSVPVEREEPEDSGATSGVHLACLDPDSLKDGSVKLVFSDVDADDETGDLSGLEFTFELRGDSWSGAMREAVGEFSRPLALDSLAVDPVSFAVSFRVPEESDTTRFEGTLACDTLRGALKVFGYTYPSRFARIR